MGIAVRRDDRRGERVTLARATVVWRAAKGTAVVQVGAWGVGVRLTILVYRRRRAAWRALRAQRLAARQEAARAALLELVRAVAPPGVRVAVTTAGEGNPLTTRPAASGVH